MGNFEKHIASCLERDKCCCKSISVEKDVPELGSNGSVDFVGDIDLDFRGKNAAQQEAETTKQFNEIDFDESCNLTILITGNLIHTANTTGVNKASGITLGSKPCQERPIILRLLMDPNLLSHEIGHAVGWNEGNGFHGARSPFNSGRDPHHSSQRNNLMGFESDGADKIFADDQWCERVCKCAHEN